jgi:hypothetical protein
LSSSARADNETAKAEDERVLLQHPKVGIWRLSGQGDEGAEEVLQALECL